MVAWALALVVGLTAAAPAVPGVARSAGTVPADRPAAPGMRAGEAVAPAAATRGCKPPATPKPTPVPTATPRPTVPPTITPDPSTAPAAVAGRRAIVAGASPAPTASPTATPAPSATPTPAPTATPAPKRPPGVDVSVWTGKISWAKVRKAGMRFAIIKATQGVTLVDSLLAYHAAAVRSNGIVPGAYHFFDYRKGVDGVAQADHFIDAADAAGLIDGALPPAVDIECYGSLGWAVWSSVVPELRAFVDRVYERTGRLPLLYTSQHMWSQVTGGADGFGDLPLWVACWRCRSPYMPTGWSSWRFWQIRPYEIAGLRSRLDGNIYRGTDASLQRLRQREPSLAGGARWTNELDVPITLPSQDGTQVRSADGDGEWGPWRDRTETVSHLLGAGEGDRTVRFQLRLDDGTTGPVYTDAIGVDTVAPVVVPPTISLTPGKVAAGPRVPVEVRWAASDDGSGLTGVRLEQDCGAGLGDPAAAVDPGKGSRAGSVGQGDCHVAVLATDAARNETRSPDGRGGRVAIVDDEEPAIAWGPGWVVRDAPGAIGSRAHRTDRARAKATIEVDGDQLAIVAATGPSAGRLRVIVDGEPAGIVDLFDPAGSRRRVVAVLDLPGRDTHAVTLRVMGESAPGSSGRRVELDAIVVLRRSAGPS